MSIHCDVYMSIDTLSETVMNMLKRGVDKAYEDNTGVIGGFLDDLELTAYGDNAEGWGWCKNGIPATLALELLKELQGYATTDRIALTLRIQSDEAKEYYEYYYDNTGDTPADSVQFQMLSKKHWPSEQDIEDDEDEAFVIAMEEHGVIANIPLDYGKGDGLPVVKFNGVGLSEKTVKKYAKEIQHGWSYFYHTNGQVKAGQGQAAQRQNADA